ncbi:MAG: hypothetical protein HC860_08630 [Alkalinema sp. RU_4_3]|nr:hypothetical protein [Alkalinema sp. RU_4_3]
MLKTRRTLSPEDKEIMVNIEPVYEAWLKEKREEGREEADRAHISTMLMFGFGAIILRRGFANDPELEAIVPRLMRLDPLERIQQVMTLSREALLAI